MIRADSGFENHKVLGTLDARGIEFSIGVKQSKTIRALIAQIPEESWVTIENYPDTGEAQIAETTLGSWRLIVRRTRLVGTQAEMFPDWRHHAFATNRTIPMLVADIDHRDHAAIELVIRDLKDQALAHFPSGRMHANSAWTVIAALAHNLGRWSTQISQPNQPVQTARSRRRHLFQIPARLTRTSRQWTLRMPARWPWQNQFNTVLDAIRALPARTWPTRGSHDGQQTIHRTRREHPYPKTVTRTLPRERRTPTSHPNPPGHPETRPKPADPPHPPHPPSRSVAVGTAVAGRPPHRSQRAELPHWAPALGDGGESLLGPGVQDSRLR